MLRPHLAADGALLRIRVPGGWIDHAQLRAVSQLSAEFGDGDIHLTSRANLQIRGVTVDVCGNVPPPLVAAMAGAGLLPSPEHERVRNIIASPLSGIVGGRMDVRPTVAELDRALCADPRLAELPGRFLFGLDDGRADLADLPCDLSARAIDADSAQIRVGGLAGPVVARPDIPAALTTLAHRFLDLRQTHWNVRQLPAGGREMLDGPEFEEVGALAAPERGGHRYRSLHGALDSPTSGPAVAGSVPLGIITPPLQRSLTETAAHGSGSIVLTPWRGIVIPALPAHRVGRAVDALSRAGLVTDPDSPWTRISACAGSPGCARSQGDTRSHAAVLARRMAASGGVPDGRAPVHIVGCDRACGAPTGPHTLTLIGSST